MRNTSFLTVAIALVCVIFLLVAVWYFIPDEGTDEELEFLISMEKTTYNVVDPLNITLKVMNNQNETVEVCEYWPGGTLFIKLYNSSGEELLRAMMDYSVPMYAVQGVELQPGEVYEEVFDITLYYHGTLWPDTYTINATYVNYHSLGDAFDFDNYTTYLSNTLTFRIELSEHFPVLTSFHPLGQEDVHFLCELADTSEESALGLMGRDEMDADRGMLFEFDQPKEVTFWMKNTLIPLDMIFIDENGFVTNVEEADVEPGVPDSQLTRYSSTGPIKWVLEVNQGLAAANGIHTGTYVTVTYLD